MSDRAILIDPATDAVINVDVQPTFMPGGGLPVASGDEIIPVVQRVNLIIPAERRYFTLDKHPVGHISLASSYNGLRPYARLDAAAVAGWTDADDRLAVCARFRLDELKDYLARVGSQTLWPDHGIFGTAEAMLHPDIRGLPGRIVIVKGSDPRCDSYSGLRDNLRRLTGLDQLLREDGVKRLFLTGLALDFCVGFTALDARELGFEAFVVQDATRAVALPGTVEKMLADFAVAGVRLVESEDLVVAR